MRVVLIVAALVLAAADPAGAARMTQKLFPLPERLDPQDATPLDLRRASFGQRGTELWLTLELARPWSGRSLGSEPVCVAWRDDRLCVGADARGRTVLRHRGSVVPAVVRRPDPRVLVAHLPPRAIGVVPGTLQWSATAGTDRLPDSGTFGARIGVLGDPPCFGAAARAGRRPCVNPELRTTIVPSPLVAQVTPDARCRRVRSRYRAIAPCAFGYRVGARAPTVALVGDSHAAHWRAAVDVAAQALGRRAMSLTSPGCTFSAEVYPAPPPIPARCRRHTRETLTWLHRHPSVRTVVTSSSAGRGLTPGGYQAIWDQVPRTVRRILVIRDVPRVRFDTAACVLRVRRRHLSWVDACPVSRAGAFPADTSAQAAARAGGRVRLLDFSRFFCDRARCYPVIGGAYVYRDVNHMNPVFNTTLGPYLLRYMRKTP